MYKRILPGQQKLDIPFNVELNPESKWVKLSTIFPWESIDDEYIKHFKSNEGQIAKTSRLAFAALYIQACEGLTDEKTREHIQENPHMQYFCGFTKYNPQPAFDASMMVHFRKRIPAEMVMKITEEAFTAEALKEIGTPAELMTNPEEETSDEETPGEETNANETAEQEKPANQETTEKEAEENNTTGTINEFPKKGTLILDATCCPQDIRYPTDIGLLNHARELLELIIDILYALVIEQYAYKPRTYRDVARRDFLAYIKTRKHTKKTIRKNIRKQLQYVARDLRIIHELVEKGAALRELPADLYKKLLVIHEVYRQQQEMYDTKKNRCDGRIVSIAQPHIRPIVRGKEHAPTEFGAKIAIGLVGGYVFITDISWENTAEATLLKEAAEQYKRMFGFYPEVIIGDRVYGNRVNRSWCKARGIRLSGPKLGRKNDEIKLEEARQIYKDGCERNAVEGKFGETKRKYNLELIMPKLPNTSKTMIAMGFFVANMERKLRLLFASEGHSFVYYDFDQLTLVVIVSPVVQAA